MLGAEFSNTNLMNNGNHSDEEVKVVVSSDESSSNGDDSEVEGYQSRRFADSTLSPRKRNTVEDIDEDVEMNESGAKPFELGRSTMSDISRRKRAENKVYDEDGREEFDEDNYSRINSLATDKIGFSGVKKMIKNAQ